MVDSDDAAQLAGDLEDPNSSRGDNDDGDDDNDDRNNNAFINDSTSSLGDAVAAVLESAEEETSSNVDNVSANGDLVDDCLGKDSGPAAAAGSLLTGDFNQTAGFNEVDQNCRNVKEEENDNQVLLTTNNDNAMTGESINTSNPQMQQGPAPFIHPAMFAAAMNPYLLAAAGFQIAAPQQQQQQGATWTLPLQFLGLNPALLQQATSGTSVAVPPPVLPTATPNTVTTDGTAPQIQQQMVDPATVLRTALLLQNGAMVMTGGIQPQMMPIFNPMMMVPNVTYNTGVTPSPTTMAVASEANGTDVRTANDSNNGNILQGAVNPSNPTAFAALQQIAPMFAATASASPQQPLPAVPGLNPGQAHPETGDQNNSQRPAIPLYLDHDESCLTAYQCFLRKQIELFEAGDDELKGTAQGRNTPLHRGQIGIRCRHCANLPKAARARGGVYYSKTIDGVYQVAQNMSKLHLLKSCNLIPENVKTQLKSLQNQSSRASGGKEYWAEGLRVLGVVEDERGFLRFQRSKLNSSRSAGITL